MKETILNGQSADIVSENIQKLKEIFPEVFCEDKIDFEKLQAVLGKYTDDDNERYNFTWWGKGRALRLAQTPSTGTLRPCKEESKDWDTTQNLYIEGDNLEVLKLLQKSYHGKVKMIYIDPPYNTGQDFVYEDDFQEPLQKYLELTGQLDEEGKKVSTNSDASGRYHTNWLNMMYPRLRLSRNLLRSDGVILISIDDNEIDNLKKICNEIFGEENFLATFVWKRRASSALAQNLISTDHEYVVCYQKSSDFLGFLGVEKDYSNYSNPDNDPNGDWTLGDLTVGMTKEQRPNQYYVLIDPKTGKKYRPNPNRVWAFIPESMEREIIEGRIVFPEDTSKRPMVKRYKKNLKSSVNPISTWMNNLNEKSIGQMDKAFETGLTSEGTKVLQGLFDSSVFNYSKPVSLMKSMLRFTTTNDDVVLDFFAGSSTLAHGILEINADDAKNRHFILVQLPESTGMEEFKTITDIGKERIHRAGEKIKAELQAKQTNQLSMLEDNQPVNPDDLDIGFKVFKLDSSNLKKWNPDTENLEESLLDAIENYVEGRSELDVVYEIMLKYGIDLTLPLEEHEVGGKKIYSVGYGALMICLDRDITTEVANEIVRLKEKLNPEVMRVVFKDNGFKDDSVKTNTKEILRNAGIDEIVSI